MIANHRLSKKQFQASVTQCGDDQGSRRYDCASFQKADQMKVVIAVCLVSLAARKNDKRRTPSTKYQPVPHQKIEKIPAHGHDPHMQKNRSEAGIRLVKSINRAPKIVKTYSLVYIVISRLKNRAFFHIFYIFFMVSFVLGVKVWSRKNVKAATFCMRIIITFICANG